MKTLTKQKIQSSLKEREPISSKKDFGHALLIAGETGRMGSAVIASRACLRTGVGMLTVCVPKEERGILQSSIPEAMLLFGDKIKYDLSPYTALGIGPAIGINKTTQELLEFCISTFKLPLLLDADALHILSLNKDLLAKLPENTIITPHAQEFDRLFGKHENTSSRIQTAVLKAKEHSIIIVLKQHKTAIVTKTALWYNTTGNAGLAKAGSGDALTGMITSFLAQGYEPIVGAKLGVYLHGLAADMSLVEQSVESLLITDVIEHIGTAFQEVGV